MKQYFIIYKPFNVLSQFTKEHEEHVTLREAFPMLPKHVYGVGRLDRDSEGLLLLTDDNVLKDKILSPISKIKKQYLAQVDGDISHDAIKNLLSGVKIRINKKDHTVFAANAEKYIAPPVLPDRDPPIRYRKHIPTSWVSVSLTEGKNRQVRRMLAAVGFPVLRLVRSQIGPLKLEHLDGNSIIELSRSDIKI